MKGDLADITRKISELSELQIAESEQELQKYIQDQTLLESKLEETLRELGAYPYIYVTLSDLPFTFFFPHYFISNWILLIWFR